MNPVQSLGLIASLAMLVLSATAAAEDVACPGAYVHVPGQSASLPLRSAPNPQAKTVMQLHDMQYVCLAAVP